MILHTLTIVAVSCLLSVSPNASPQEGATPAAGAAEFTSARCEN